MKRKAAYIFFIGLGIVSLTAFALTATHAEEKFPIRPVELVAPASPGGGQDLIMRAMAQVGEKYLGQPLIPLNRDGGGGAVGAAFVAHSKPDGYRYLISSCTSVLAKPLVENLPYKGEDFIAIGQIAEPPEIISVQTASPWKTIKMFVEDAKKNPEKFRYSSGGAYNPEHIVFAYLSQMTGIKLIHIPAGGGAKATAMLLGGHVEISCAFPPVARSHIMAGSLRPLAVNSTERLGFKEFKDIPTVKEEFGYTPAVQWWMGMFAPKDTPRPIVQKLRSVLKEICKDREFVKVMTDMGYEVKHIPGEEFEKIIKEQRRNLVELFKSMK